MIDKYFCPIYNCIILPVVFLTTRYKNSIHFIQFVIACYLLTTRNIVNIYDKGFEDKNNVNLIQSSNDYVHDNEAHFYESYRRYVIWPLCKGVTRVVISARKIYEMLAKPQIRPSTKPKLFHRGVQWDSFNKNTVTRNEARTTWITRLAAASGRSRT